jgi:hypothetical protein
VLFQSTKRSIVQSTLRSALRPEGQPNRLNALQGTNAKRRCTRTWMLLAASSDREIVQHFRHRLRAGRILDQNSALLHHHLERVNDLSER